MVDNSIVIVLVAVVTIHFVFKKYIEATKDVPDLYLQEQSLIDATRLPSQSAIYKSNKLDYGNGLRVGLDIRYDHYKLRHGNPCDVWELLVLSLKKNPDKTIVLNDEIVNVSHLNYMVDEIAKYLTTKQIQSVGFKYSEFLLSLPNMALVFGCLVSSTLVSFYETSYDLEHSHIDVDSRDLLDLATQLHLEPKGKTDFENKYTFDKDKGVRVQLNKRQDIHTVKNTQYLAVNMVSAIASSLRHVPPDEIIGPKDTMVIVNSGLAHSVINVLTKILTSFVANTKVIITNNTAWSHIMAYNPTVLYMEESSFDKLVLDDLKANLSFVGKLKFRQSMSFLSQGKLSNLTSLSLRMLVFYKNITDPKPFKLSSFELNELRALFSTRIVVEYGYDNLIGPLILNDFYDYRVLDSAVTNGLVGNGCIFQSLEIKLVNLDQRNYGDIMIRGYNIGKVNKYVDGEGLIERVNKDNDGFMSLEGVKGKWGTDGCLYVYKS